MLKFYVSLMLVAALMPGMTQDTFAGHEIIGTPKCKACHKAKTGDQWKIWTQSAHAGAFETLASGEASKIAADRGLGDPRQEGFCLKCHVTRAFLGVGAVVSEKGKYADNEGVGCEACHGPGSGYKSQKIMKDPQAARAAGLVMIKAAETCIACHNKESPTFRGFDFEQRWAEIAHPVPTQGEVQSSSPSAIASMPDEISFKSSVGDVLFPHDVHVKDHEVECDECHHQIHAMELDTPHPDYLTPSWTRCQTCHNTDSPSKEKYYKCSDCHHSVPNNIADETLSSKVVIHKSCWKCHESGTGAQASEGCGDCHVKEQK